MPSPDLIRRMELVSTFGVHDTREWRVVEALARQEGSATIEQLVTAARLTLIGVSAAVLHLGHFMLSRFDPFPIVTLNNVTMLSLKSFNLPPDALIALTGKGWQIAEHMGYGRPALIVPDSSHYEPEIADLADPEAHLQRLATAYPFTRWALQPALAYHEAA